MKEWGAGEMWVCPKVLRVEEGTQRMGAGCEKWGRGCERMGCWGDVGVLGDTKNGGRSAKNGDEVWLMGARV